MIRKITFRSMGTEVQVGVSQSDQIASGLADGERVDGEFTGTSLPHPSFIDPSFTDACLDEVKAYILKMEQKWSRFIRDNDLDRLNRSQGEWIEIDADMVAMLRCAEQAFFASQGIFTPFLAATMEQAGYDASFQDLQKQQSSDPSSLDSVIRYRNPWPHSPLEWSKQNPTLVRLHPSYRIDAGGIAKGWIVERAEQLLLSQGLSSFVVNAGGDMVCSGTNEGRPWKIGIEHPLIHGATLTQLEIDSLSVATSGTYRRQWTRDGQPMHHIIDPRTGEPAVTDLVSCTVVHHRLVEAEWMAKVALILGSDEGIKWIKNRSPRGWIVVRNDGEVSHSWNWWK